MFVRQACLFRLIRILDTYSTKVRAVQVDFEFIGKASNYNIKIRILEVRDKHIRTLDEAALCVRTL